MKRLLLIPLVLFLACEEKDREITSNVISGKVIDISGNPVEGAVINLRYLFASNNLDTTSKIISHRMIKDYPIPLQLTDEIDNLLMRTSPDSSIQMANNITINGMNLLFGVNVPDSILLEHSLPPAPPAGAFDVRFVGDTKLCTCENMPCVIEIMSTSSELTIDYDIITYCYWGGCQGFGQWLLDNNGEIYQLEGVGTIVLSGNISSLLLYQNLPDIFEITNIEPRVFEDTTYITYGLPNEAEIDFWITDYCETETVVVMKDTIGEIGCDEVVWDGNNSEGVQVKNGAYFMNYQTDDVFGKELIFLLDSNPDTSIDNIITNDKGRFSISQNCLPFGFSSEEYFVSRYVNIIASHNSYETNTLSTVFIDPHSGADVTIQLQLQ